MNLNGEAYSYRMITKRRFRAADNINPLGEILSLGDGVFPNFTNKGKRMKTRLLELFSSQAMVVADSPLLSNAPDMEGETGSQVYVSWVSDDEGNTDSVTFEHEALENAHCCDNSYFITDVTGNEMQVSFYELTSIV